MTRRIKVLLVDDHPLVLEGIRVYLATRPNVEVVGEATGGREAVRKVKELDPDVVLMDLTMPGWNGLEATRQLVRQRVRSKVLILTAHDQREYVFEMIQSGARGYVMKDSPPEELVRAIEAVHAGAAFFSPQVSSLLLDDIARGRLVPAPPAIKGLSRREAKVLALVADGNTTKQIAEALGVGVRTAETYRERLMRKLRIHSIAGLTKFALARGVVRAA
jgi:two-component system nitrate/nitrite response regulator NarL